MLEWQELNNEQIFNEFNSEVENFLERTQENQFKDPFNKNSVYCLQHFNFLLVLKRK